MARPPDRPAGARREAREGRRRDRLRQLERRHSGQALGASRRARRRASAPHRGRAPERVRDGDRRAHEIAAARGRGARRRRPRSRHLALALALPLEVVLSPTAWLGYNGQIGLVALKTGIDHRSELWLSRPAANVALKEAPT